MKESNGRTKNDLALQLVLVFTATTKAKVVREFPDKETVSLPITSTPTATLAAPDHFTSPKTAKLNLITETLHSTSSV
jgi:hypothetical protein